MARPLQDLPWQDYQARGSMSGYEIAGFVTLALLLGLALVLLWYWR
jgi:hypothetical protein